MLVLVQASLAYDVVRQNTHNISQDLVDEYSFEENFSSLSAWTAYKVFGEYFVQSRAPGMQISFWSVERKNSTFKLRVTGVLPDFVKKKGDNYKVGGKGFIDEYCEDPEGVMSARSQLVESRTVLPEGFTILSLPENYSIRTNHLFLNYTARLSGRILYERIYFRILDNISAQEYCTERRGVEKALLQGVIITHAPGTGAQYVQKLPALVSALVTSVLLVVLAFSLVKRRSRT